MENKLNLNEDSLFDQLKLMKECPLCTHKYNADKVVVLKNYGGNQLVHVTCPECQSAILHMIMTTQFGASAMGIMTDLSAKEIVALEKRPRIDEDELLEFHKYIQQPNNQFEQIFSIRRRTDQPMAEI